MCSTNHPVRCLTGINILYEGVLFSSLRVNTNRQVHRLDILNIKPTSKRCGDACTRTARVLGSIVLGFYRIFKISPKNNKYQNPVLNYGYRIQTLFQILVNGSPPCPLKGISSTKVVTRGRL